MGLRPLRASKLLFYSWNKTKVSTPSLNALSRCSRCPPENCPSEILIGFKELIQSNRSMLIE